MEHLSLFELNKLIKTVLDKNLEPSYWVVAEISEMRTNQSGHCYLELVEKDDSKVVAKTRATIWSYTYRNLSTWFEGMTGEPLRAGLKILCNVAIQYHELYGMSINIKDIDAGFTIGERAKIRQQVIDRLVSDGVFDMNHELPLPLVPQRIAVISSPTAAGFGDFMDQINGNQFDYEIHVELFKSIMQGDKAPESIIQAIHQIHERLEDFDLLVIIRGGGSQVDLDCFDNYDLASHLAQFPIPVVSGIGHERDETVTDLVAHTKMKTPTAVAEFIISGINTYEKKLEEGFSNIYNHAYQKFLYFDQTLSNANIRLRAVANETYQFSNFKLLELQQKLSRVTDKSLNAEVEKLSLMKKSIELLDPQTILNRGYSLTVSNGKRVSKGNIKKGDVIQTLTKDMRISSKIEEIKQK